MKSVCNLQYSLNRSFYLPLVALLWTVTLAVSVKESAVHIHVRGEVGGNITIHCPHKQEKDVFLFYFQTGRRFVNGYYQPKPIQQPTWENTRVDHNEMTVEMYGLNTSHNGVYVCIIQYINEEDISEVNINFTVTANYSKPTFDISYDSGGGCLVTCASHGGYPATRMMWNIPVPRINSSHIWKIVNSSEVPSPSTTLYKSSSSAYFNCSNGKLSNLSCSVGDVTSDMFVVCQPTEHTDSENPLIIVAICATVAVIMLVVLLLYRQCKKRHTGAVGGNVRQEWGGNQCEEVIYLNENKGGKEAS